MLKKNKVDLSNKFVTQITTSKHFYDITAHKYVEQNMFDLNAKVIKGLSADMEDLTSKKGQQDAIDFFYSGILSFAEGIDSIFLKRFSWATVKLYYSIYYLIRASMAANGYATLRCKGMFRLKIAIHIVIQNLELV